MKLKRLKQMKKVIRDGKVAILYSPGYGAGWYTWNTNYPQMIFHPKIVELIENNKQSDITEELMLELFGDEDIYLGGSEDLTIKWVPEGTAFRIEEYDGSESIITNDSFMVA